MFLGEQFIEFDSKHYNRPIGLLYVILKLQRYQLTGTAIKVERAR